MKDKFALVYYENGEQKILKNYKDEKEALEDIGYKDPSSFFIADMETKQGMTLEDFIKKYE